jgi:hypothetical protein
MSELLRRPATRLAITLLVCVLAATGLAFATVSIPTGDDIATSGSAARPLPELCEGRIATQEFISTGTEIEGILFQVATFGRRNAGHLEVKVRALVKGKWQTLAKQRIAKRRLVDNEFKRVEFTPPLAVKRGQRVAISLRSSKDISQAISWWTNPDFRAPGMRLTLDGVEQTGAAVFSVNYKRLSGSVAAIHRPVWKRITLFLRPPGRRVMIVAAIAALFCFVHLVLWGARAPLATPEKPR